MITIPKSWNEVSIKKWKELSSIESESQISVLVQRLSILSDTDQYLIRQLPMNNFNKLISKLDWLKSLDVDPVLRFELDGVRYGIIPDLNYISAGEWLDVESWQSKPIENMHLISALLYRPITWEDENNWKIEKHQAYGFQKRADLFLEKLPITTVYGSVVFFSNLGIRSIGTILDCLNAEEKAQKKKTKTTHTPSKKSKKKSSTKNFRGTT